MMAQDLSTKALKSVAKQKPDNTTIKYVNDELKVQIDNAFNDQSELPVQNKVITGAIGDISTLATTSKEIVGAINEVNSKGGSGGSKIIITTTEPSFYGKEVTVALVGGTR